MQGILPCQYAYDATTNSFMSNKVQDGDSHCLYQQDFTVCERQHSTCFKTVKEYWLLGSIKSWTVVKGCGKCSFVDPNNWRFESTCGPAECLKTSGLCSAQCFPASERKLMIERCTECEGELCNMSSRRWTHHAVSLACLALFVSLLLRKCQA